MNSFSDGGAPMDTPDLSTLSDNIDSTDDLLPSLQVDITSYIPIIIASLVKTRWMWFLYPQLLLFQLNEEFSTDILDDVQSLINPNTTKPENVLTWL